MRQSFMRGDIRVTMDSEDGVGEITSLKLDITKMSKENILECIEVLKALIEIGDSKR